MKPGGYIEGLKKAKRLVSEGIEKIELSNNKYYENPLIPLLHRGALSDEPYIVQRALEANLDAQLEEIRASKKYDVCIAEMDAAFKLGDNGREDVKKGIEMCCGLLTYENIPHFPEIKAELMHGMNTIKHFLNDKERSRYMSAFFIGPE